MKSRSLIILLCALAGTINLSACAPSKSSLKEQLKENSITNKGLSDNTGNESKLSAGNAVNNKAGEEPKIARGDLSDLQKKLQSSKIDNLRNSAIICTVNGDPITVGDYRHQFKLEQEQMEASLATNPQMSSNLIQMAKEQHVSLSPEEKDRLSKSANKMENGTSKGLNKVLSENHMTKSQFQEQIFDVGLAFKMASRLIEEGLLDELISRKLLCQAAKKNGFSKEAMNKYNEVSKSAQYKKLVQISGMSDEDLRNEIVQNELCLKQIEKIKNESPLSEKEISDYYEKNRGRFRHGPRIKLSQIFISKTKSITETPSVLTAKLKSENPKMSDADIKKKIDDIENGQKKLAEDLLKRALNGEDFASLANQYSEDTAMSGQKNGGDLGYQEEDKLDKTFAAKVAKLPAGTVAPEVISSPFGFHIFKVTDRENKGFYKLSEVKETLKQLLAQEKGQQVVQDWIAHSRKNADIVISPEMKTLIASNKLAKRD